MKMQIWKNFTLLFHIKEDGLSFQLEPCLDRLQ
jgi:hypothetical protein